MLVPVHLLSLYLTHAIQGSGSQIIGLLLLLLAFYYLMAARREMRFFFQWTVFARSAIFCFLTLLVFYRAADPLLLLFGLVDLIGALWTMLALRSSKIAMASNEKVISLAAKRHLRYARGQGVLSPPHEMMPPKIPTS